jgi:hypothetical protein
MAGEKILDYICCWAGEDSSPPDFKWVEAADNTWGVRVLDVQPVTQNMLSASADEKIAANAISFLQDDGTGFIGVSPESDRVIEANLKFPIDRFLADGPLFIPNVMEHKWAIFYHGGDIICVRSWIREVRVVARVKRYDDHIEIVEIRGVFIDVKPEDPDLTIRTLDYLLRSHVLEQMYPVPLPPYLEGKPGDVAMWCMSMFGNMACYATPHTIARRDPEAPLRSISLLHIAVARGDVPAIERHLAAGVPIDLLGFDGLAPLHWALLLEDTSMVSLLLDRESPVDVRAGNGETPLMNAAVGGKLEHLSFLLDHGADVNARDDQGHTALHRAAYQGHVDVGRLLLERGAHPDVEADGETPLSLAESQDKTMFAELLRSHGTDEGPSDG